MTQERTDERSSLLPKGAELGHDEGDQAHATRRRAGLLLRAAKVVDQPHALKLPMAVQRCERRVVGVRGCGDGSDLHVNEREGMCAVKVSQHNVWLLKEVTALRGHEVRHLPVAARPLGDDGHPSVGAQIGEGVTHRIVHM